MNENGLPKQVQAFFTEEMTDYAKQPKNILQQPFQFNAYINDQKQAWTKNGVRFTTQEPGTVKWESTSATDTLKMEVTGAAEFDGFVSYSIRLIALEDVELSNTNLTIPYNHNAAKYMMG